MKYVDKRSMPEKLFNLVGVSNQDVGRSFALIAGVSKYPNMQETDRDLPAAAADIEELVSYLKDEEFFDEIVGLKDGDVTRENLRYFLEVYFPDRLKKSPKARFLFAYSGHGMSEGSKEYPTGYLLTSSARNFSDKLNGINMAEVRLFLDADVDTGYQTLALINACYSGAFISRRSFGGPVGSVSSKGVNLPGPGAHAITAGGSGQQTWHDPKIGKGSVFFEKMLAGLGGQADLLPLYPDGHRGDGIITVDEITTYLRGEVGSATGEEQTPVVADLAPDRSLGGFFFLSRQKTVEAGLVRAWNPARASAFGAKTEETVANVRDYFREGQFEEAFPLFRAAADAGDAASMGYVGYMYEDGQGTSKDYVQAVRWYRKAADGGDVHSMANLGAMYQRGLGGLVKDDAEAESWYRKAANAGDSQGMLGLGSVSKDDTQAESWYRKAANAGNSRAMGNLGVMYDQGRGGLPKDDVQALSWFRNAAYAGDAHAMSNLGLMYEQGRGGLDRDVFQAVSWFSQSADAGDALGMAHLGFWYANGGGGLPKDDVQAVRWFGDAADAGDAMGMTYLGILYAAGRGGLSKDDAKAVNWFSKAADAGDAHGMTLLGSMYQEGLGGLPKDEVQAANWFGKAAEGGDPLGMTAFGLMCAHGSGGLAQDDIKAASWFRKAADAGDAVGMANLGFMYLHGLGRLPVDKDEAIIWYRRAADSGEPDASAVLKTLIH